MFSTKTQTLRIESEIDKSREEGNWIKVIELAEQLRIAYPSYGELIFILNSVKVVVKCRTFFFIVYFSRGVCEFS